MPENLRVALEQKIAEQGGEIIGLDFAHADSVVRTFEDKTPTLLQNMGSAGGQIPCVMHEIFYEAYQHHGYRESSTSGTLTADQNSTIRGDTPLVCKEVKYYEGQQFGNYKESDIAGTVLAGQAKIVNNGTGIIVEKESQRAKENANKKPRSIKDILKKAVQRVIYVIRRLTPVECERLQGYPDNWTKYGADGTEIADTARYRAIGNSICVFCAERVYLGILDALTEVSENGGGQQEEV